MHPYVTIGAQDPAVAHRFYDAVLSTIGYASHAAFGEWRGYSPDGSGEGFTVWICTPYNGEPASVGNGMMVAFPARSRAEVDAFHQEALAQGGSDEGAPGIRLIYTPTWYATYVRDPSGNKIACYINT